MDLTKGRKSTNVLDRRPSNEDAYIAPSGRKFANQEDYLDTYAPRNKPEKVKLGDLYKSAVNYIKDPELEKKKTKTKIKPKVIK
jgi:hypothetical protein